VSRASLSPLRAFPVAVLAFLVACSDARVAESGEAPLRIVFHSERDGDAEIYVANADGSDPVRLTFHSAVDQDPDVSPDGRRILFTSNRTGDEDVFVVGIDGGEPTNLTSSPARDGWARWSPDGRRIVFHSERDGDLELYTMNADGSDVTRVTERPGADMFPEWWPDGGRILFRRDVDLWASKADGTEAVRFTAQPELDQMPSVSPDGLRIAFMSLRDGYCSIFVMNADGSDQRNMTPKGEGDAGEAWCSRYPAWGLDGRIYFSSRRPATNGDEELFAMNPDGSGLTRLTAVPGRDVGPRPFR